MLATLRLHNQFDRTFGEADARRINTGRSSSHENNRW